jgi:hypothetical protein
MRFWTIVTIGGALTAATPALAQNATYPEENAAAPVSNEVTADNVAADANLAVIDTAAAPAPAPVETAPPPAEPARRGFPWGLLGLVGLVGLFGRRNRSG